MRFPILAAFLALLLTPTSIQTPVATGDTTDQSKNPFTAPLTREIQHPVWFTVTELERSRAGSQIILTLHVARATERVDFELSVPDGVTVVSGPTTWSGPVETTTTFDYTFVGNTTKRGEIKFSGRMLMRDGRMLGGMHTYVLNPEIAAPAPTDQRIIEHPEYGRLRAVTTGVLR